MLFILYSCFLSLCYLSFVMSTGRLLRQKYCSAFGKYSSTFVWFFKYLILSSLIHACNYAYISWYLTGHVVYYCCSCIVLVPISVDDKETAH